MYEVKLKLGTIHMKDSLHTVGKEREEITGCSAQLEDEANQKGHI
jgi:hypothetical protein